MKIHALLSVAAALLIAADAKDDAVQKDKAGLQGTWKMVSVEQEGRKFPDKFLEGKGLIFQGDKVTLTGEADRKGTYAIDPTQKPATLDLTLPDLEQDPKDEGTDKTRRWIYQLDGDNLKICGYESPGKDRPKEFVTKKGDQILLMVFKREKK
jgi:uncharacterized protein (TIGR03067 family)